MFVLVGTIQIDDKNYLQRNVEKVETLFRYQDKRGPGRGEK